MNNRFTPGLHASMPETPEAGYTRTIVLTEGDPVPSPEALAHLMKVVLSTNPCYVAMTYTYSDNTLSFMHDARLREEELKRWITGIMRMYSGPANTCGVAITRAPRRPRESRQLQPAR